MMDKIFPGVFKKGRKLLTQNLIRGRSLSEELLTEKGKEFRVWDPHHSKAAAAIAKGLKSLHVEKGSKMLYLGIANGNTASFFSDIIGREGIIYGVEISDRSLRDLNHIAEKRSNIVPILGNAKKPGDYSWVEKVDVIFQDVAASDQSEILIRNAKAFLKKGGHALLAIKSRSIDVTKEPDQVYKQEIKKLEKEFKILEKKKLDPFEKDHLFLVMKF
jgi:fibrillarin-like pre-rRNA processing protein